MQEENKEYVILVDEKDNQAGIEEKMKAHKEGKLHRAFSIFIFNSKKELLIQKRHDSKYHSKGLWSNTVCSHPKPNEPIEKAAHRRLKEEMGFDCDLKELSKFHYKVVFEENITENEIDHIFIGEYDGEVQMNKEEVSEYKWISIKRLKEDVIFNDNKYTVWLKIILNRYF